MTIHTLATLLTMITLSASGCSSSAAAVAQDTKRLVALQEIAENQSLQWPSIAVRGDTAFVAGNVFSGESLVARPAYLGRVRWAGDDSLVTLPPLELPLGDFQFAYPRIAFAGSTLHLVWVEFESRVPTVTAWRALTNRPTTLWHARLERGTWCPPERITTAYQLGWNGETGGVAVDASGTLHVAVWRGVIDSIPHVHGFHLAGGKWSESFLPYTGLNSTAAIATRGDTVVVAVVDEVRDTTRLMVVESADHGAHWTNAVSVLRGSRLTAHVTRLAFAPIPDGLLLAIGEKGSDFYLDTIRVVQLKGGLRPAATRFIDAPEGVDGFELAALPCGSTMMLLRTFSSTPQIFEARFTRDSLTPVIRPLLAQARVATFPGIAARPRSAIAIFGYDAAVGSPWRSVATSLRGC